MDRIQTTLAAFGAGDTTRRIALGPDFDDRFHDISVSINDNLDRIETATQTLENTTIAVAHDLRTPLTRASLALQAFQASANLTEAESDQLDLATGQMAKLSQTFDTILRISNIGAHKGGAAFATFDLNDLVQDIVESYAPVLEDAGFALVADRRPPVPISADKNMLGQLIVNLLTNILRHCPTGSTAHIDVSSENGPCLCIWDNGPGVPETAVESVFHPFHRLDVSRSTEGTGLGLAMVMAIAKHHGASITAENLTHGFSVTIYFQKAA
jgi:signal transduction histidine kinase